MAANWVLAVLSLPWRARDCARHCKRNYKNFCTDWLPAAAFGIRLTLWSFPSQACMRPSALKRIASDPPALLPCDSRSPGVGQMKSLSDEELMTQVQAGHGDALAILFNRYHRLVLSIALKILRDPGEAEDVMQNVFLEIFRAAAQFDPAKGTTKMWLLQYAYHRSINRRRHLNTRYFYDQSNIDDAEPLVSVRTPLLGRLSYDEVKHLLHKGMAKLSASPIWRPRCGSTRTRFQTPKDGL